MTPYLYRYYDDTELVTRVKLLCVNITVLTGIGVDLDSDCHNHYLGSIIMLECSKVTAHHLEPRGQRSPSTRSHLAI